MTVGLELQVALSNETARPKPYTQPRSRWMSAGRDADDPGGKKMRANLKGWQATQAEAAMNRAGQVTWIHLPRPFAPIRSH
jgi:hypothetical protein